MEAEYDQHRLLHTEVRRLFRGRIEQQVFELRKELFVFLNEHNSVSAQPLRDDMWNAKLAYLADSFDVLNGLNASYSLQGLDNNILHNLSSYFYQ
jgi:hypothetical protein